MATRTTSRLLGLTFCALGACASGPQRPRGEAALQPLEEIRAMRVIDEVLRERGLAAVRGQRFRISARRDFDCDAFIGPSRHCIEFVVNADREVFGQFLPRASRPGAIVVAPGVDDSRGADVLVLDDRDYAYDPDPERAGEGRQTLQEIEDRLRRTLIDYITWLRENGRL